MYIDMLLYFILYYVSKGVSDKIRYQPILALQLFSFIKISWFSDWLLIRGKFAHDKRNFWLKYPFSFVSDGWHFFDGLRNLALLLIIITALTLPLYWVVILWAVGGGIFEIVYNI